MRRRMVPLIEPFRLRWLEERDSGRYSWIAALKPWDACPSAAVKHEFTLYGFRELLEARRGLLQFDVKPRGGIHAGSEDAALAEAYQCRWFRTPDRCTISYCDGELSIPHRGIFPAVDVEIGTNCSGIFSTRATPVDGSIDLDENVPGLG